MSKEQYLRKLRSLIRELPADERKTILDFYREILEDKMENGQPESEAVAELGDVYALARKILAENPNRRRYGANRIAGFVVASVFAVLIVAGLVANALNLVNLRNNTNITVNAKGESDRVEDKAASAPASQIKEIMVDARNREVQVVRGTDDDIRMEYRTDESQTVTVTTDNGVMKLVQRDRDFHIFDFFSWRSFGPITVNVPEQYAGEVYLKTSNATISADDMQNITRLTCDTTNGKVGLSNIQAEAVNVDTSNAHIELNQVKTSDLRAKSSNGSIQLTELTSPKIDLHTSNASIRGNICGREEDYSIHTDTSNSSCSPSDRSGGSKSLTADTSNADIHIEFTE
ncbi:MAG TPA: DUF4097 family beta strand repeat-containing protein [Caproiciproducens sp.]|nr:DUF4097 family beta strand repeat-containing protein [Caproiciproducens sp.]